MFYICLVSSSIVQSYTGKYDEFVSIYIVRSVQHEQQCQRQQASDIASSIAGYYGDNDLTIQTLNSLHVQTNRRYGNFRCKNIFAVCANHKNKKTRNI